MTSDIITRLKAMADPKAVEGMARCGINPENTYGVSIPNLRKIARETGKNHALAREPWTSGIQEARILASVIDDPKMATEKQLESWQKKLRFMGRLRPMLHELIRECRICLQQSGRVEPKRLRVR